MKEALEVVKKQVEIAKSENKKLVFALILDEMNIRKQLIWDPSKKNTMVMWTTDTQKMMATAVRKLAMPLCFW